MATSRPPLNHSLLNTTFTGYRLDSSAILDQKQCLLGRVLQPTLPGSDKLSSLHTLSRSYRTNHLAVMPDSSTEPHRLRLFYVDRIGVWGLEDVKATGVESAQPVYSFERMDAGTGLSIAGVPDHLIVTLSGGELLILRHTSTAAAVPSGARFSVAFRGRPTITAAVQLSNASIQSVHRLPDGRIACVLYDFAEWSSSVSNEEKVPQSHPASKITHSLHWITFQSIATSASISGSSVLYELSIDRHVTVECITPNTFGSPCATHVSPDGSHLFVVSNGPYLCRDASGGASNPASATGKAEVVPMQTDDPAAHGDDQNMDDADMDDDLIALAKQQLDKYTTADGPNDSDMPRVLPPACYVADQADAADIVSETDSLEDVKVLLFGADGALLDSKSLGANSFLCQSDPDHLQSDRLQIGVKNDVDLLLYTVDVHAFSVTPLDRRTTIWLTHVATFPGLNYVQESKKHKKFFTTGLPPECGYALITEFSRYAFAYRSPAPNASTSSQVVVSIGHEDDPNAVISSASGFPKHTFFGCKVVTSTKGQTVSSQSAVEPTPQPSACATVYLLLEDAVLAITLGCSA